MSTIPATMRTVIHDSLMHGFFQNRHPAHSIKACIMKAIRLGCWEDGVRVKPRDGEADSKMCNKLPSVIYLCAPADAPPRHDPDPLSFCPVTGW